VTTIAVRDGVMAADSQSTYGHIRSTIVKMWRVGDAAILGTAGDCGEGLVFKQWVMDTLIDDLGHSAPKMKSMEALIMTRRGIFHYCGSPIAIEIKDPFYAIGSGSELALGAMAMGADAKKAVQIAARWDVNTGGRISTMSLDKIVKGK
jgi:ATP-dependent protease HslVU (ClpYQ) peptidase subunit